ncbi:MAG: hypothetical protein CMO58_02050 [Verrucomicrobiales bacterium]|nr:hypothetical protein [Verrucomicrobiales bacterium]
MWMRVWLEKRFGPRRHPRVGQLMMKRFRAHGHGRASKMRKAILKMMVLQNGQVGVLLMLSGGAKLQATKIGLFLRKP